MDYQQFLERFYFKFKHSYSYKSTDWIYRFFFCSLLGMKVGKKTKFPKGLNISHPSNVVIGDKCNIEENVTFKLVGKRSISPKICIGNDTFIGNHCEFNISKFIQIGDNALIASGCKFIDHDHGTRILPDRIRPGLGKEKEIMIGNGVWLGVNVIVLKGTSIGDGAIVAAGAVVNRKIPPFEIWGGIPAKKLGERSK